MTKKVKMPINTILWYAVVVFGTINFAVAVAVIGRNLLKKNKNIKSSKSLED